MIFIINMHDYFNKDKYAESLSNAMDIEGITK